MPGEALVEQLGQREPGDGYSQHDQPAQGRNGVAQQRRADQLEVVVEGIEDEERAHDATAPARARHPNDRRGEKGNAHDGLHDLGEIAVTGANNTKESGQPDAVGN